jgi:hypothetical protein
LTRPPSSGTSLSLRLRGSRPLRLAITLHSLIRVSRRAAIQLRTSGIWILCPSRLVLRPMFSGVRRDAADPESSHRPSRKNPSGRPPYSGPPCPAVSRLHPRRPSQGRIPLSFRRRPGQFFMASSGRLVLPSRPSTRLVFSVFPCIADGSQHRETRNCAGRPLSPLAVTPRASDLHAKSHLTVTDFMSF